MKSILVLLLLFLFAEKVLSRVNDFDCDDIEKEFEIQISRIEEITDNMFNLANSATTENEYKKATGDILAMTIDSSIIFEGVLIGKAEYPQCWTIEVKDYLIYALNRQLKIISHIGEYPHEDYY